MTTTPDGRAARAAPQSEAQQGAARARHPADGQDRRRAVLARRAIAPRSSIWVRVSTAWSLRYGFMEEPDVPAALRLTSECGAEFKMMDTSFFLARQTCWRRTGRGWRSGAKSCSRGCCATRKARWSFSACRPTASSNWAARSRFEPTASRADHRHGAVRAARIRAAFDAMRTTHFPPERNELAAHLTLFHHLPPAVCRRTEAPAVGGDARGARRRRREAAGLMSLGRGVAVADRVARSWRRSAPSWPMPLRRC